MRKHDYLGFGDPGVSSEARGVTPPEGVDSKSNQHAVAGDLALNQSADRSLLFPLHSLTDSQRRARFWT